VSGEVRVIGIGNPDRGDDGVGPAVASEVATRVASAVDVLVSTADPSRLIERWGAADTVILVDAVLDAAVPGTVSVFDATTEALPADCESVSSHGMGVAAAVELARSLGRLPEHLIVVGVTGSDFEGVGLTSPVESAVPRAVEAVMEVVAHA
jgi:hydrogenase maturation protease